MDLTQEPLNDVITGKKSTVRVLLYNYISSFWLLLIDISTICIYITNMIFSYPNLESLDFDVLDMIREQRARLRFQVNENPIRWTGFLRRNTIARAIQGSNSIEGIHANLAEAVAIVDDERPETLEEEATRALQNYRIAMTYILSTHHDPHLKIDSQFIKSLHFMMMNYDMTKSPGQWRNGPIYVVHEPTQERVYEGPDAELIPTLVEQLATQISHPDDVESSTVLGAMAHLNLTMIHPFKDGNGRMARALQTLVIARNGVVSPELSSIEEWLGRNTEAYYSILADIGQGRWNPERNALPWVRFCLVAHYQQAATILKRNQIIGRVWTEIELLRRKHKLPERVETSLMDATFNYKVRNERYRNENNISDVVASRDLRALTELGLLVAVGQKRGRYYIAGERLKEIFNSCVDTTRAANPYEIAKMKQSKSSDDQFNLPL